MLLNSIALIATLLTLALLSNKKLSLLTQWRATVTPLASIIGSGFLIVAPLLHSVLGKWALAGMIALSLLAYFISLAIRFNIQYAENHVAQYPDGGIAKVDMVSEWCLGIAYAISVAFYVSLFSAFVLDRLSMQAGSNSEWLSTIVMLAIMVIAWLRGSHGLEWVELIAVTIKLSIIIGVLVTIASYDAISDLVWVKDEAVIKMSDWDTAAMLAGMIMVTQGFETARFTGAEYSQQVRIKAVKYSLWISIVIYLLFVGLTGPVFLAFPIVELNETTISRILGQAVAIIPVLLLVAAIASQLSAALADTLGGGGLVKELVPTNWSAKYSTELSNKLNYLLIIAVSITLTWTSNIFEIINFASKGFASYYLLQVLVAALLINHRSRGGFKLVGLSGCVLLVSILLFIIFWSIPAPHT